ncbi:hypothetical protein FOCC_FOCC007759 [Frankliniella occidentalis]|nr:hypothetical protein FOCC_FOCC007759 [Frankliniella occidentalis]
MQQLHNAILLAVKCVESGVAPQQRKKLSASIFQPPRAQECLHEKRGEEWEIEEEASHGRWANKNRNNVIRNCIGPTQVGDKVNDNNWAESCSKVALREDESMDLNEANGWDGRRTRGYHNNVINMQVYFALDSSIKSLTQEQAFLGAKANISRSFAGVHKERVQKSLARLVMPNVQSVVVQICPPRQANNSRIYDCSKKTEYCTALGLGSLRSRREKRPCESLSKPINFLLCRSASELVNVELVLLRNNYSSQSHVKWDVSQAMGAAPGGHAVSRRHITNQQGDWQQQWYSSLDDHHQRESGADNNTVTNVTVQLGGSAFLHCRVRNMGERTVSPECGEHSQILLGLIPVPLSYKLQKGKRKEDTKMGSRPGGPRPEKRLLKRLMPKYKLALSTKTGLSNKVDYFDNVTWVRRRDWHILTSGISTYTNDERFQVLHPEGSDDWTLQIKYVQRRDNGTYECQEIIRFSQRPTTVAEECQAVLASPTLCVW